MGRNEVLLQIHATVFLSGSERSTESQTPRKSSPPFTYTPLTLGEKKKICLWDKGQWANFTEGLQAALMPEGRQLGVKGLSLAPGCVI